MSSQHNDLLQERQFRAHIAEYGKLRDEALQRVVLQNNNVQYSLITTGIFVTLLGILFKLEGNTPVTEASLWIASFLAFIYAILIELLIGNWIFQLGMMFQICIYQTWRKAGDLSHLVENQKNLFRWEDNRSKDPWLTILGGNHFLGLLQVAFLYGLVGIAWISNAALLIYDIVRGQRLKCAVVTVFEIVVLVVFLLLAIAHKKIYNDVYKQLKIVRDESCGTCEE